MSKKVIILAGPNGAGKTTFARSFLPEDAGVRHFINADLIAAGLSPFQPESAALRAGRIMLEEMAMRAARGDSFAFETTLSGRGYLRQIAQWRSDGYAASLYFLSLPNAETAIERVRSRVEQGGHHIPDGVVRRRFTSGLDNFHHHYKMVVDDWGLYDNTGVEPVLIEWGENG